MHGATIKKCRQLGVITSSRELLPLQFNLTVKIQPRGLAEEARLLVNKSLQEEKGRRQPCRLHREKEDRNAVVMSSGGVVMAITRLTFFPSMVNAFVEVMKIWNIAATYNKE